MVTAHGTARLVYRRGRLTESTFTPRPGIDTASRPGQAPGLSTFETLSLRRGEVAQVIEVALLQPPLRAVPDDVAAGGTPGHVSITPVDAAGGVDQRLLEDWAATRGRSPTHPLTDNVLQAVVQINVRQPP
jgi:hypothetical protein